MKNINKRIQEIKETPRWITITSGVVLFLAGLSQFTGVTLSDFLNSSEKLHSVGVIEQTATSTIPISEIITKILQQSTFIEQGDLLDKYKEAPITGHGRVVNVSRAGEEFLVDIRMRIGVKSHLLTCLVKGDETEILLLKGKVVDFQGTLSGSAIWNHGLGMGECIVYW